jgi:hypothetical protein
LPASKDVGSVVYSAQPKEMTMHANEIESLLELQSILNGHNQPDAAHNPYLLEALTQWKDGGADDDSMRAPSKPKRAKAVAVESDDSTPDGDGF